MICLAAGNVIAAGVENQQSLIRFKNSTAQWYCISQHFFHLILLFVNIYDKTFMRKLKSKLH